MLARIPLALAVLVVLAGCASSAGSRAEPAASPASPAPAAPAAASAAAFDPVGTYAVDWIYRGRALKSRLRVEGAPGAYRAVWFPEGRTDPMVATHTELSGRELSYTIVGSYPQHHRVTFSEDGSAFSGTWNTQRLNGRLRGTREP